MISVHKTSKKTKQEAESISYKIEKKTSLITFFLSSPWQALFGTTSRQLPSEWAELHYDGLQVHVWACQPIEGPARQRFSDPHKFG